MSTLQPHSPPTPDKAAYAHEYALGLLHDIAIDTPLQQSEEPHPAILQATTGLMWLCGDHDGGPELLPVPISSCAEGVMRALAALPGLSCLEGLSGARFITERAAIIGHQRRGRIAPGESCRIVATQDGAIALNLARQTDWDALPALFGKDCSPDWDAVEACAVNAISTDLISQGRLLGMAIANGHGEPSSSNSWLSREQLGTPVKNRHGRPRVLDMSSLWAGPLCTHLWSLAGAQVIKFESIQRPDGARNGSTAFFNLLNTGKEQVSLDLTQASGVEQLTSLIRSSDIVIEGSRPRALQQLGIDARALVSDTPGLTWLSITGHGRRSPQSEWIGFGDDAAVAGGLSHVMHVASGKWRICGDAIADPLSGLHMALAGWASWLQGGGELLSLSLAETVRHCITQTEPADAAYGERLHRWQQHLNAAHYHCEPPAPQPRAGVV